MKLGQIAQHNNMKPNDQFYGIPFPVLYPKSEIRNHGYLSSDICALQYVI
jgi:hypothetical protein